MSWGAALRCATFAALTGALLLVLASFAPGYAQTTADTPPRQVDESGALLPRSDAAAAPPADAALEPLAATLDYSAWEAMAVRSENTIQDPASASDALDRTRAQLVDWREALSGAQNANSTRIATLRTQIAALGAAPAEGTSEPEDIAKRRIELTEQLVRLQAPGIAADEAYRRADGLIREIDRVQRERQADQLLQLWPMPVNPANWPAAVRALSGAVVQIGQETASLWRMPGVQAALGDNLPVILALLVLAVGILWRGRLWIDRLTYKLQNRASVRGQRIWAFLASLGQLMVPFGGVMLLSLALLLTGLFGPVGLGVVGNLPHIGLMFFAALWLGGRMFPVGPRAEAVLLLSKDQRAEGRFFAKAFGLVLGLEALRAAVLDQIELSEAAAGVLAFPFILVAGGVLLRMGQFMARHVEAQAVPEDGRSYGVRLIAILARAAMVVGVAGPVLAAIGYVSAAAAMVFPAILSLGLIGLLSVLQRLVGDIYAMIMRREDQSDADALVPVLVGFGLTLGTIPLFALIWGARTADLTELWTRFREGFQLGNARISPTDFLFFAVVFGLGYTLTRMFQGALKSTILPRTGLDQGAQNATVSGVGYVGIFLAALIAINSAGIDLSGLAIVAGALSVGIGFGLQNIVSNFVSGIILLIERPVSEGDWIEVGTTSGIVKSISVRSTRIQTFDRSDVIVPNSDLIAGRVTNWTRFNRSGRLIVPVAVPFTTDSRRVEVILREIAENQPLAVLNPAPIIALIGFGAETMNFEIRVILRDVYFQVQVRSEINHQIAERFAAEGILQSSAHRDHLQRLADAAAQDADDLADGLAHERVVAALLGPFAPPAPKPVKAASKSKPRAAAAAAAKDAAP